MAKEIGPNDQMVSAEPVEPPLTRDNAIGRWVFVPADKFGGDPVHVGGWTGQIKSVEKRTNVGTTGIKFKPTDPKEKATQYFAFDYVFQNFKPIN